MSDAIEQERKRFEAWAQSQGLNTMMVFGNYYLADTAAAWKAWQARCPEGWQVVPKEPDLAMVDAASEAYMPYGDMRHIWDEFYRMECLG